MTQTMLPQSAQPQWAPTPPMKKPWLILAIFGACGIVALGGMTALVLPDFREASACRQRFTQYEARMKSLAADSDSGTYPASSMVARSQAAIGGGRVIVNDCRDALPAKAERVSNALDSLERATNRLAALTS